MSSSDLIKKGDQILLYLNTKKKWLVTVADRRFHTHKGIVDLNDLIGKKYGTSIETSLGYTFWLLPPTMKDKLMFLERQTQIIYPKDIGYITLILDLSSGKRILEVGTGSAALTTMMANLIRPRGHVYTYEMRNAFVKIAERNIAKSGLSNYVTIKNSDASKGVDEKKIDAAVIDVGAPWQIVPSIKPSIKPGGLLCSFSPTINQIEKTVETFIKEGFIDIESCELIKRNFKVDTGKTRPTTIMIGHTGYITSARKVLGETGVVDSLRRNS